jgi:hypothetical protein
MQGWLQKLVSWIASQRRGAASSHNTCGGALANSRRKTRNDGTCLAWERPWEAGETGAAPLLRKIVRSRQG